MTCTQCGDEGATPVRVEYVESSTETLRLCEACRAEFADGDLVTDVSPISTDEDAS